MPQPWTHEADFVVVGSGAAGLTAALTASHAGLDLVVLEKSGLIGGTTAISGGVVWIPRSRQALAAGLDDPRETVEAYMHAAAQGRGDAELIRRYIEAAPRMAAFVEDHSPVELTLLADYPDYQPELEGGRGGGRSLDNALFDTHLLGEWRPKLRPNPYNGRAPITITEAVDWKVFANPMGIPFGEVRRRSKAGLVHGGASLVGNLLLALLQRGLGPKILLGTAARGLEPADEGLVVVAETAARDTRRIHARRGVLLASGGFEWSPELRRRHLRYPVEHPASPPVGTGDGLRMAQALGADVAHLADAWWCPAVALPGETWEGTPQPMVRPEFAARCLPHSIIVNRSGRRFTNEAGNYNDVTKPFFHDDPASHGHPNVPAWLVCDATYRQRYILVAAVPGREDPPWLHSAPTLDALAEELGVDPAGLSETVARFNSFAAEGVDADFGRGASAFDRFYGDPRATPNPNLGPLATPPFYALPIYPGTIGTKGGPRIDHHARVLTPIGAPIEGLYAAGNAAATLMGSGYPGAGATIGQAMTFGYLAARHAAGLD